MEYKKDNNEGGNILVEFSLKTIIYAIKKGEGFWLEFYDIVQTKELVQKVEERLRELLKEYDTLFHEPIELFSKWI